MALGLVDGFGLCFFVILESSPFARSILIGKFLLRAWRYARLTDALGKTLRGERDVLGMVGHSCLAFLPWQSPSSCSKSSSSTLCSASLLTSCSCGWIPRQSHRSKLWSQKKTALSQVWRLRGRSSTEQEMYPLRSLSEFEGKCYGMETDRGK